ncbi:uncharacterized protein LOC112509739 isoform X2 [Cynara cardunculus var. scolymus]|uniref:uncharacterized protein LOC112509739 isoform X2 n=1 Tax=Cynara cardunculus var. scolymus TaxID=59895 RepID=UPI000D62CB25|nr:uncharacterized protein LOC112509739 isoform X2 [Cynara cardunculus var. scolymus]
MQCPSTNSFIYNSSLCACNPGYWYNATANKCSPSIVMGPGGFVVGTGVDYSITFPETVMSFDSIKKYTQSQGLFLGATLVLIVIWLLFCFLLRFRNLGDGRNFWYKIRWGISRLDICFATRHWLDDQKVVKKRKTELGGALSIASCILFIGLFAALLYQIILKRTIEVHSVRAANAPDLTSFSNDMEFNITTISSMSCSNLRNLGTLLIGNPGFLDFRTAPLSTFANFSCQNTTKGPMVMLKCNNCHLIRDNFYTSWQFLDLPNMPATAVGFEFNLTARDRQHKKHMSFVSGILKNGSTNEAKFVTFRGKDPNILQFNLFPRIYRNKHDLKLIQPLFHEFLPGSSFDEINQLRDSLQSSENGLVNITLHVSFLSAYIVEVDDRNILGPVRFLADLGGLYCVSIGLFFYLLVQFEYRFKKLRHEDSVMRRIRNRRKAQERWDELRKYVIFTWGRGRLPPEDVTIAETACCSGILTKSHGNEGSSFKRRQQIGKDTISFNTKVSGTYEKKCSLEQVRTEEVACSFVDSASMPEEIFSDQVAQKEGSGEVKYAEETKENDAIRLSNGDAPRQRPLAFVANGIPLPPSLETVGGTEVSASEVEKNIEKLYEYNVMLREELIRAQSILRTLTTSEASISKQR